MLPDESRETPGVEKEDIRPQYNGQEEDIANLNACRECLKNTISMDLVVVRLTAC